MPNENEMERDLGRLEGAVEQLSAAFSDERQTNAGFRSQMIALAAENQRVVHAHLAADAEALAKIHGMLEYLKATVDRIKKPVDAFITARNIVVGLAAVCSAVGLLIAALNGALGATVSWVGTFFHH